MLDFKDKHKIELKAYKDLLDQQLKTLNKNNEAFERNLKERCDKGKEALKGNVAEEIKTFYDQIESVKIENGKYNYGLINQCKELKGICDEFPKVKIHLDKKLEEFVKLNELTNKHADEVFSEFELFKTKFSELSDFIKVNRYIIC